MLGKEVFENAIYFPRGHFSQFIYLDFMLYFIECLYTLYKHECVELLVKVEFSRVYEGEGRGHLL